MSTRVIVAAMREGFQEEKVFGDMDKEDVVHGEKSNWQNKRYLNGGDGYIIGHALD